MATEYSRRSGGSDGKWAGKSGLPAGRTTQSSGSSMQDEVAANSALDNARNEILNNSALAVGEDVVIRCIPEASQVSTDWIFQESINLQNIY